MKRLLTLLTISLFVIFAQAGAAFAKYDEGKHGRIETLDGEAGGAYDKIIVLVPKSADGGSQAVKIARALGEITDEEDGFETRGIPNRRAR